MGNPKGPPLPIPRFSLRLGISTESGFVPPWDTASRGIRAPILTGSICLVSSSRSGPRCAAPSSQELPMPMPTLGASRVKVATWSDLEDRSPAYALVAGVDLVVIRFDDRVSVMFGRCHLTRRSLPAILRAATLNQNRTATVPGSESLRPWVSDRSPTVFNESGGTSCQSGPKIGFRRGRPTVLRSCGRSV
jgi:hypothetical protein